MVAKRVLLVLAFGLMVVPILLAQDTQYPPKREQIPGPPGYLDRGSHCCFTTEQKEYSEKVFQEWIADIRHFRMERLIRAGYNGSEYVRTELKWTQSSFIQPQMMMQDRYFYDPVAHRYTVERYLDDLKSRYGGIDSVLIWHTYPNIGIDNRNEYDWLRDMPGGIAGVRQMIEDFHRHGVKVLFPVMLWDQGTRDEGVPNWTATARLLAEVGADGVNGDTLNEVPLAFRKASDATGHPLAFEPEGAPENPAEALAWNNMSWGYWEYPFAPMVSLYKWLEPRHMVNVCNRWARDKTDDLQAAFFNGVGFESWENIWGIWNQITPRDAEALRRVATIERAFPELLISRDWTPHTPTLRYGIFASMFPGAGETLWTLVNRNQYDVEGKQIEVPYKPGTRYFDLWHGVELKPDVQGGTAALSFDVEAEGFGSVLGTTSEPDPKLNALLATMRQLSEKPLGSFSHEWKFLPQHVVEIHLTKPASAAPTGMVLIPGGDFTFDVHGIEVEGGNDVGVDVQEPWEDSPRRYHHHRMSIHAFYIDRYPVTNAEFRKFLDASHYHPQDDHNFLKDWKNGTYPEGWGNKPVTWVSLEDARAYAAWAGKRLPHELEWQYAAQGADGRLYPWGNDWDPAAVPPLDKGNELPPPSAVDSHPKGASPFGVMDLVGNVWQFTDEFEDPHTSAAILRGGSHYHPQGTRWYFPEAFKLNEHGKFLLMAPSTDRSGTVGFRCVEDAE
ncbi:MAG TPA: SUMF1/EgtB/PvdO family nonheme iron enzyme [Terriglobia bacterium]|nr:SUMF1/EgtB/PvdO family nonheme iron enzyme [Terriglobia bacterium]